MWSHVLSGAPIACVCWRSESGPGHPIPLFYPSPRLVAGAPPERLAYVASFDPLRRRNDEMTVVDLDTRSPTYRQIDDPIREEPRWRATTSAFIRRRYRVPRKRLHSLTLGRSPERDRDRLHTAPDDRCDSRQHPHFVLAGDRADDG